jgi:hypothetical protein
MKKFVASVGLVALSASALHAAYTEGMSELDTTKPWSASLTLRGFYDDNIGSSPTDPIDSTGFEINPSLGFHWVGDTTMFGASYTYSGKYYDEQNIGTLDDWSHSHIFDALLQHAFSPRANITARNSFVIGQEPDLLRAGDSITGLQRVDGDNVRNYGTITFNSQLTKVFGISLSYANSYWNYDDQGTLVNNYSAPVIVGTNIVSQNFQTYGGSWSGLLDRMEQSPNIEGRWQLNPQTVGKLGYRYRDVDFSGDEVIGGTVNLTTTTVVSPILKSDARNYRSHLGYAGVEHSFRPDLHVSFSGGVNYTDSYNDPNGSSSTGPYISASLTWESSADTTLGLGVSHDFTSTDLIGETGDYIRGVDNTVGYVWFRHRLAPALYLAGQATVQYSTFDGGGAAYDGESDFFFTSNISLEYQFNKHFSGSIGYSYDDLDSDIGGRGYDRSRVYFGITAAY